MRSALLRKPIRRLNRWWGGLPVRHKGAIVVAIPSVCVLITSAGWVGSRQLLLHIRSKIDYSQTLIQESQSLQALLLDAESGVRGYSVTRDPDFLESYYRTQAALGDELAQFRALLQQDSDRSQLSQTMTRLVQQRLDLIEELLTKTQSQPQGAPTRDLVPLFYQGKQAMDRVRQAVDDLEQQEQQALSRYFRERDRVTGLSTLILWVTLVVSLFSLFAAVYLFSTLDQTLQNRDLLLRESKSLLQAIVSSVVDGVVALDRGGRVELFNPSAAQMFGYAPYEVIGKQLDFLLQAATPPNGGEQKRAEEFRWQTQGLSKAGVVFPVEVSVSDVQLDDRQIRQIVILRDISEFQQIEAKLQARADELSRLTAMLAQANTTLEKRNQELEQFAYVASHDLKAPLRAIANLSEWLEEDLQGQLPEENQHQMRLLRGRVLRMEALINGLLEYSRVGRTQTPTERVAVNGLLMDILDSIAPPATFTINIQPGMPTLYTKRVLLRQVFANLISNAIKHHDRPDGQITIAVADQNTHYEFSVADDGPGIAPEYHDKIFAIFQTLEARDIKESTGIGLSIVKKIIESEGGSIHIASQPGSGATFYFTWPKREIETEG